MVRKELNSDLLHTESVTLWRLTLCEVEEVSPFRFSIFGGPGLSFLTHMLHNSIKIER